MCKDLAQHGLIQTLNRTRMPHTAVNRTAPWLNRKSFRKAVGGPKASFKRLMFNFLFTTVSQLGLVTNNAVCAGTSCTATSAPPPSCSTGVPPPPHHSQEGKTANVKHSLCGSQGNVCVTDIMVLGNEVHSNHQTSISFHNRPSVLNVLRAGPPHPVLLLPTR